MSLRSSVESGSGQGREGTCSATFINALCVFGACAHAKWNHSPPCTGNIDSIRQLMGRVCSHCLVHLVALVSGTRTADKADNMHVHMWVQHMHPPKPAPETAGGGAPAPLFISRSGNTRVGLRPCSLAVVPCAIIRQPAPRPQRAWRLPGPRQEPTKSRTGRESCARTQHPGRLGVCHYNRHGPPSKARAGTALCPGWAAADVAMALTTLLTSCCSMVRGLVKATNAEAQLKHLKLDEVRAGGH